MQSFDVFDCPPAVTVEKKAQGKAGVRRRGRVFYKSPKNQIY